MLVSSEVVSRFLIGQSISWVNGTARFLLVWFFMIGASLALRQGGHGRSTSSARCRPLPQTIVYYLAQILTVTFLLELLWSGVSALEGSFPQTEGSLGISMAWVMSAFPWASGCSSTTRSSSCSALRASSQARQAANDPRRRHHLSRRAGRRHAHRLRHGPRRLELDHLLRGHRSERRVRRMFGIMGSFPLLAIPLFSMIGILAERCGMLPDLWPCRCCSAG